MPPAEAPITTTWRGGIASILRFAYEGGMTADGTTDELEPDAQQRRRERSGPAMVVGIGASAGGIRALSDLFAHVPPRPPIAYVVILHLSPDHDSKLAEVLQTSTTMPVRQVTDTVSIEPAHVYVIPPNQALAVRDGTLQLTPM